MILDLGASGICEESEEDSCIELCEDEGANLEALSQEGEYEAPEVDSLKAELDSLREELRRRDELEASRRRIEGELEEFFELYPESDVRSLPDEVWEKVKGGIPLVASFALYQRKSELAAKRACEFNEKNRRMSAGSLTSGEAEAYYSPEEVKKMTSKEVKKNYDDIVRSMRHWN